MDFSLTPKTEELRKRVSTFMDQYVFPIEKDVQRAMGESGNEEPQSLKDVRKKAKAEGLWNLFLPDEKFGAGLKNYEYAPLCELMGRSQSSHFGITASQRGEQKRSALEWRSLRIWQVRRLRLLAVRDRKLCRRLA